MFDVANKLPRESPTGPFRRYAVVDVLNNTNIDREKVSDFSDNLSNKEILRQTVGPDGESYLVAPRNSVIAKLVSGNSGNKEVENVVMYPFFSSHLCLPVKPGEHVWGFEESSGRAFWVSRIHEPDHVEDLNYTHGDRRNLPTIQGINEISDPTIEVSPTPGFQNGDAFENRETDTVDKDNSTIEDLEKKGIEYGSYSLPLIDSYETIVTDTNVFDEIVYEPVPRFTKRPGDLAIQGSNNTSIVLGTERGYGTTKRPVGNASNSLPKADQASASGLAEGMGAIDIVVGRGRVHNGSEANADAPPADTRPRIVRNSRDQFETDKNPGLDESKASEGSALADAPEGDPDFLHDASRVYMSMKTDPDTLFGLSYPDQPFSGENPVGPTPDNAAIVFKSDQIRIVARKDEANGINGSIRIIKEGAGDDDRATIVIQPDGSIMIDGPRIIIGDGREDTPDGVNGEGTQVILGRDATESILLGDTLITMLKDLEKKFNDHIHNTGAGPSSTHVIAVPANKSAQDWVTSKSKVGKTK